MHEPRVCSFPQEPATGSRRMFAEAMSSSKTYTRRRVIATSAAGIMGAALAGFTVLPLLRYLAPEPESQGQGEVTIPRSRVGLGQAHFFPFRGHPAVVLQVSPGEFIALSAVCTHLGCIVTWQKDAGIFLCPCHGGRFSKTGKVLSGPPPAPLPSYSVKVEQDQLIIGLEVPWPL